MATPTKKTAKRQCDEQLWAVRQEEILTQAARLFAERGFDKTDTTLLAETVGVGKGTVYRYFPSKRELFLAAADRVMRMLREHVDSRIGPIEDPLEQIAHGIHAFLDFFGQHPGFVELLIQERALFRDRKLPTFLEHRKANMQRWQSFYRELIAEGRLREIPVERITDVIGNLLYGAIFMNHFGGQAKSAELQASDILDVFFHGILSPRELQRTKDICAICKLETHKHRSIASMQIDRRRKNVMSSRWAYAACGLLLACAIVAGCKKPSASGAPAQAQPKPPEVVVSTPVVAEVTDYEDFTGRTVAFKSAEIRPHVTGYIDKVLFTEGADVKQDALLYEIDPRIYEAEVERARSNVSQAEAHLRRLNLDLQRANIMLPQKTIARQDYDQIVGDQAEAEAAVGVAKATLHAAEVNLGYTKIDAPFAGRLSRTMMDPGNLVKVDETVLTTIVQIDPIYVMFGVDERLLKKIHDFVQSGLVKINSQGQIPIMMGLANEDGFPHEGYVDFVDNRLDQATGSLLVRGLFANPKKSILPGLFCRVRLPLGEPYRAITIPEQALGTDQGQKFVYVVDPKNTVQYRSVQIGKQQGTQRVILKGVQEGDRVVISGLQRVRAGVVVEPKMATAATASADAAKVSTAEK